MGSDFIDKCVFGASKTVKVPRNAAKRWYKTNQVCALFDVSRATLFRWEREGLISGPPRDWRNWRLYSVENVDEIKRLIQGRKVHT